MSLNLRRIILRLGVHCLSLSIVFLMISSSFAESGPRESLQKKLVISKTPIKLFTTTHKIPKPKILDASIIKLKAAEAKSRRNGNNHAQALFNLIEVYWIKSKSVEEMRIQKQEKCATLKNASHAQLLKTCAAALKNYSTIKKNMGKKNIIFIAELINSYPRHHNLDAVYFFLASSLFDATRKKKGLNVLKVLLSVYPNSKYIPHALLLSGDHYVETKDLKSALKMYKNIRKFKKSPIAFYGRYKEAWCYYQLDQPEKALNAFVESYKIAKKKTKLASHKHIIKQARKDIVVAFSQIGLPGKAMTFFKRVSGSNRFQLFNMLEGLALIYSKDGKYRDSNVILKRLLKSNNKSIKVLDYQRQIVRNSTLEDSFSKESFSALSRLIKLVVAADDENFNDLDKKQWARKRAEIGALIQYWISTYRKESNRNDSREILIGMETTLQENYRKTFPTRPRILN